MDSPCSVPEPVEHSQQHASRAGLDGLGNAHYQTKPNPDRYSETKPKPLTLVLLWILRALLRAADPFHRYRDDCALGEHGQRLAESFGKTHKCAVFASVFNWPEFSPGILRLMILPDNPFEVTIAAIAIYG
jgi:hypothetical protein